jgi:hypothetical protein
LKKAGRPVDDELGGLGFTIFFDAKQQSAVLLPSAREPPPHFVAFVGDARAFFPAAVMFKTR